MHQCKEMKIQGQGLLPALSQPLLKPPEVSQSLSEPRTCACPCQVSSPPLERRMKFGFCGDSTASGAATGYLGCWGMEEKAPTLSKLSLHPEQCEQRQGVGVHLRGLGWWHACVCVQRLPICIYPCRHFVFL